MHDGKHRCYIDNTKKDGFVFSFFEGSKEILPDFTHIEVSIKEKEILEF